MGFYKFSIFYFAHSIILLVYDRLFSRRVSYTYGQYRRVTYEKRKGKIYKKGREGNR